MRFEGLDGAFGKVVAVNVGGYKLVGSFPVLRDGANEFRTGFIVKDLVSDSVATCLESGHEPGV